MALQKVSTTKGSTNSKRRAPRQVVKDAAKKLRRAESKRSTSEG